MTTPDGLLVSLQAASDGGFSQSVFLMLAFVAIFYFVMWRPQQKEAKQQAALLASIQKGDRVVTASGLHGKIQEVKGDTISLEVAPGVNITVERESVRKKLDLTKTEPKGA